MSPRRPRRWDLADLGEAALRWPRWPPGTSEVLADEPRIPFGPVVQGSRERLHCTRCGEMEPFLEAALDELKEATARDHGFELETYALAVYGVCSRCQARRRRPPLQR
jgi:hypothetical protein